MLGFVFLAPRNTFSTIRFVRFSFTLSPFKYKTSIFQNRLKNKISWKKARWIYSLNCITDDVRLG